MNTPTEAEFLKHVASHVMTAIRDDGIHRHLRFKKPETTNQYFDLVTWPGSLCFTGDMGTFVFSRVEDMFTFFRSDYSDDKLHINLGYWAEKLDATDRDGGHEKFSPEKFRANVIQYLKNCEHVSSGEVETHADGCVFPFVDGHLGSRKVFVLPSERSAGDERKCLNHCGHDLRFMALRPATGGLPRCWYEDLDGFCGHRCTFAPDDERKCVKCGHNFAGTPSGVCWHRDTGDDPICGCKCRFAPRGGIHEYDPDEYRVCKICGAQGDILCGKGQMFAPREAERHEFKPGMSSNLCGVATKDWIACNLPREAEVHIGRDTKKMPPTEYQKPFKVKKVKEYGGDVQQMSSPYKEVGFWFDRYAVVDAKGKELTRFSEKADAKMVVDAMNKRK